MSGILLRDDQWEKIYAFLKDHPRAYAGEEAECRLFARRAPHTLIDTPLIVKIFGIR